jgi:hypothetical protein
MKSMLQIGIESMVDRDFKNMVKILEFINRNKQSRNFISQKARTEFMDLSIEFYSRLGYKF